ncbi:hypothetical protein GLYMA_02G237900v4 [Glycine max]|uniref:Uncharacterized protein n=1 Tax=Glycine max TaxID=3847 RepID=I1JHN8_SOYBN|nr:uncharacterized protein LOC100786793 [Glycine max]KAG5081162.1 hypothetical protein JHK86_005227 [Glycine max]KRH72862.1 hypothetical protein GLYMA_02G237900v4 [Glycine max]|eukprot:XP_014628822.1 uncharacterized protein LOC100786793 [Glycine max]
MRVRASFFVLFSLSCLLCVLLSSAQQLPPDAVVSARLLDSHLQDSAFRALFSPITGVPYDAQVPTNLSGIKVSAMRLRSGSLRTRGVLSYKEFEIPIGVVEKPYVERLVLVYQNLGNWSDQFYPLPGFSYLAPVLGLLAYSGINLSASELPELDIRASEKPVLVNFPHVRPAPLGALAKCVYFDLHGSVQFDTLLPGNVCSTMQQGHFSIVVESNAPSPAPSSGGEFQDASGKNNKKNNKFMLRILAPCVVGGIVLLIIILGLLVVLVRRHTKGTRMQQLECVAYSNEIMDMTSIGDIKVPLAFGTRTRPMIEHDYFP